MATNGQPVSFAGVVTVPVDVVHFDIQEQVQKMLATVEPGTTMAVLRLHTHAGANLAIAHRFENDLRVSLWVGKSGWDQPLKRSGAGGIELTYAR